MTARGQPQLRAAICLPAPTRRLSPDTACSPSSAGVAVIPQAVRRVL